MNTKRSTSAQTTCLQEHHHLYQYSSFKLPKNDYRITYEETYLQDTPLQRPHNNVEIKMETDHYGYDF